MPATQKRVGAVRFETEACGSVPRSICTQVYTISHLYLELGDHRVLLLLLGSVRRQLRVQRSHLALELGDLLLGLVHVLDQLLRIGEGAERRGREPREVYRYVVGPQILRSTIYLVLGLQGRVLRDLLLEGLLKVVDQRR